MFGSTELAGLDVFGLLSMSLVTSFDGVLISKCPDSLTSLEILEGVKSGPLFSSFNLLRVSTDLLSIFSENKPVPEGFLEVDAGVSFGLFIAFCVIFKGFTGDSSF